MTGKEGVEIIDFLTLLIPSINYIFLYQMLNFLCPF